MKYIHGWKMLSCGCFKIARKRWMKSKFLVVYSYSMTSIWVILVGGDFHFVIVNTWNINFYCWVNFNFDAGDVETCRVSFYLPCKSSCPLEHRKRGDLKIKRKSCFILLLERSKGTVEVFRQKGFLKYNIF